jgi:hypothetical protein
MKKRGQMKISFGMIFSIILIIAFIAFAIYAIIIFLDIKDTIDVSTFVNDLQNDVNTLWQSSEASRHMTYYLPEEIEKVCFYDGEGENLAFISEEDISSGYHNITHLDITETLNDQNAGNFDYLGEPYGLCFINTGKINMLLKKDFGKEQVYVRTPE